MQKYIIIGLVVIFLGLIFVFQGNKIDLPEGESVEVGVMNEEGSHADSSNANEEDEEAVDGTNNTKSDIKTLEQSMRTIYETDGVKHSVPIEEIRQGCFGRDCIPSVDDPVFVSVKEADKLLPDDTIGIGLVHNGETRFYPFNMLVTKEIVNDVVGGDALAVTYCPLCGTGIVFEREIDGKVLEFGVSGMLWQSNLLMYNREENEEDISLWSQVLGEAVLGVHTGTKLPIIRSDIVRYTNWREGHPKTTVLNTGRIGDPYGGDYYRVARSFEPDFNESESPLPPMAQVLGIEIDGQYKAYDQGVLKIGTTQDTFAGRNLEVTRNETGEVRIKDADSGEEITIVSGFWFSWFAVHPETELYTK